MSLDQDFCDSPYQFMKKHVVIVKLSPGFTKPANNEVTAFVVENVLCSGIANPPDAGSKVCHLHLVEDPGAPAAPAHTRRVYWCHYEYNSNHGTVLGKRHAYMFTPEMDGCTFGAGSQAGDGSVRVVHCNEGEFGRPYVDMGQGLSNTQRVTPSLQMQAHKQMATLDAKFTQKNDSLRKVVSPFAYMKGQDGVDFKKKATTFGRRSSDQWEFYSMVYRAAAGQYFHCGVKNYAHNIV